MVDVSVAVNYLQIAVFSVSFCCNFVVVGGGGGASEAVEDMKYFIDISSMIAPF